MGKLVVTPEMLERLKYLLEHTDMSVDAISTETGMARATVNIRGKQLLLKTVHMFPKLTRK